MTLFWAQVHLELQCAYSFNLTLFYLTVIIITKSHMGELLRTNILYREQDVCSAIGEYEIDDANDNPDNPNTAEYTKHTTAENTKHTASRTLPERKHNLR